MYNPVTFVSLTVYIPPSLAGSNVISTASFSTIRLISVIIILEELSSDPSTLIVIFTTLPAGIFRDFLSDLEVLIFSSATLIVSPVPIVAT